MYSRNIKENILPPKAWLSSTHNFLPNCALNLLQAFLLVPVLCFQNWPQTRLTHILFPKERNSRSLNTFKYWWNFQTFLKLHLFLYHFTMILLPIYSFPNLLMKDEKMQQGFLLLIHCFQNNFTCLPSFQSVFINVTDHTDHYISVILQFRIISIWLPSQQSERFFFFFFAFLNLWAQWSF